MDLGCKEIKEILQGILPDSFNNTIKKLPSSHPNISLLLEAFQFSHALRKGIRLPLLSTMNQYNK